MPLEEYRRKRDFAKTPEPAPGALFGTTGRFVIQRHRATRLHYDFRLEVEGVLVSWAVPKGLTLDPAIRRMAVHVEDHPIEYFDFEGVIPAKQYGSGDVIVWDWGTWEPEAPTLDPRKAIADGELKFQLRGEKVKGRFTIVRTSGRKRKGDDPGARAFEDDAGEQWLLIAKRGRSPRPAGTPRTTRRASRRAARTTTSRPTATPSGTARRPPPRPRSTSPVRSRRPCPSTSIRCSRPSPRRRSVTPTGSTRSNGTATASRRSSPTARSGSGRATSTPRRPTSRGC